MTAQPLHPQPYRGAAAEVAYAREDFAAYAHEGWPRLVTTAHLLSGDPREATELVRHTLVGVYARWRRIPRDDVDFYVRRSLAKGYLRRARRPARHRKASPPVALEALSARQRVVLVLLHWEGLGEVETAQLLGCSAGAVRSHAQRGLAVCGGGVARLRGLFAEAAEELEGTLGVEPFAVPLGTIERRGRALRRRRIGAVVAACALLLAPSAVLAAGLIGGGGATDGSGARVVDVASSPIRIVAPGERVEAVPGVQLWLTADGKHWSTPQRSNQFRGLAEDTAVTAAQGAPEGTADVTAVDGGAESRQPAESGLSAGSRQSAERGQPGVSVQPEPVHHSYFLSGMYHGLSTDPSRVEASVGGAPVTGTVLTLAGSPGWGVWYVRVPLSAAELKASFAAAGGLTVTVYDAAGRVVARSGGADAGG
ncbi:sigma factor-like helix-turn-helix DNA-binding protein [Streptomyces sp. NPDC048751]|uniref:sigma factor-like helix-turn-helix DNA-binding protein n=1 Tax=Streptomyces sp. NPDC048751 TaxID=3365591 RepID=UPI00371098B9